MRPNGLVIAVAVLAVLGGAIWFSNKKQASASKNTDTSTKILSIPDDQFQDIRIKTAGDQVIDLKRENGKWAMTQPTPLRAVRPACPHPDGRHHEKRRKDERARNRRYDPR